MFSTLLEWWLRGLSKWRRTSVFAMAESREFGVTTEGFKGTWRSLMEALAARRLYSIPSGVLIFIEFPAEVCNFPEVLDKSSIFFKDTAQRDIFERGCLFCIYILPYKALCSCLPAFNGPSPNPCVYRRSLALLGMVGFYGEDHSRLNPCSTADLPGFRAFSRKALVFLWGPSRILAFFKEGPGFSLGTFQDFDLFQGRSWVFCRGLPYF